ncbi:Retrotransposon protein, Ty1-Copia subclass [Phytophthora palmivora]|uniref:Retrotransposon protein, Ty1-Copia subclass n=1 Tax=Phytophthora palmivora TaxID=4796 RepID=A0A2P4YVR7_9STRA|nr:Retrotransposon protein, Ty1-Copia subclass [Phytophthora palmivora]
MDGEIQGLMVSGIGIAAGSNQYQIKMDLEEEDKRQTAVSTNSKLALFKNDTGNATVKTTRRHSVLFTFRVVLVTAVVKRMKRVQLDVKTAFLNSGLSEEIYLEPGEGNEVSKDREWRLLKALYGLKQASGSLYEKISAFLLDQGFRQGKADYCLFVKNSGDDLMIMPVYVDDILVFAMQDEDLVSFKTAMEAAYKVIKFEDVTIFWVWNCTDRAMVTKFAFDSRSTRLQCLIGLTWIKQGLLLRPWKGDTETSFSELKNSVSLSQERQLVRSCIWPSLADLIWLLLSACWQRMALEHP